MSQSRTASPLLTSEPLLEISTKALARCRPRPVVRRWLHQLEGEGELIKRSLALTESLRKRIGSDSLKEMLKGLFAVAADDENSGIAGLAAFMAVRAQGSSVIEGIFEFRHLHRVGTRYRHRRDRGQTLEPQQAALLDEIEAVERELADLVPREQNPFALPSPLDLGAARVPRKVFGVLHEEIREKGELSQQKLKAFVRLARLEQHAAQQRAAAIAGEIDPYAVKAVGAMMPRLAELDVSIRDVSNFLDALDESRDCRLFNEQHSVFLETLAPEELARVRELCETEELLQPTLSLLQGLHERPLENKKLIYYSRLLMEIGRALFTHHLRPVPIDSLESVLLSYRYAEEDGLRLPVGPTVEKTLQAAQLPGLEFADGELIVRFDLHAARRVRAPLGLPFPPTSEEEEGEERENVKDLIMANINNTSILLGLLRNPKVVNKPGIVTFIASSCRLPAVLEYIATTKKLHSGFANKDVPLAIVRSPVRLPVKLVRRFIHVKYIRGVELRRLARDKSGLRREIYDEIQDYLSSLA